MSVTPRQVVDALKHRYVSEESTAANVTSDELATFLRALDPDKIPDNHAIVELVAHTQSDWILSGADVAVLQSIRDCMTMIFKLIDLDEAVATKIRRVVPTLSAALLQEPALPLRGESFSVLSILDRLLDATIGWSNDQGRAGEKLLTEVSRIIEIIHDPAADFKSLETDFSAFLEKEQVRTRKLEERLAASESGKLRSQRGRAIAAETINDAALGHLVTANLARFLHGPWYESLQLIAITKGVEGEDWIRACKLTETMLWTYQPIDDEEEKKRLYRIVEHMPFEIRDLLLALEHSGDESNETMSALEEEQFAIVSGHPLELTSFKPIEVDGSSISQRTSVSRILLRKVKALRVGQWFTYAEDDKSTRIKLVLKLEDVHQLLFTNRNGMKALEKNFDEMAYLMSSSIVKPLNHDSVFSSTFATFYRGLLDEHQRKLKLAKEADEKQAEKETARKKALQEANVLNRAKEDAELTKKQQERETRLERARAEASKVENQAKLTEFSEKVEKLSVGAWLKLPAPDGKLEECKLAVRVTAVDKLIFVSRTGVKMGEYSSEQLTTLLVAGECVIDDTGVEFEDTLAQVVSKLRQDRNKSYDDLTGS
jgi:hypothetical protein